MSPLRGRSRTGTAVRVGLLLVALYAAAGYVTLRVRWVSTVPGSVRPVPERPSTGDRVVGAVHVHTGRSHDAVGSEAAVAAAATSAGLDFVLLADHWRAGGPADLTPVMRDGVLIVHGQEISLGVGRVLAAGLDTVLHEWDAGLAGFVDRLRGDSGVAITAHPRSPRTRDRWRAGRTPGIAGWEAFDLADVARARMRDPWVVYHAVSLLLSPAVGRLDESLTRLYRGGFRGRGVAAFDSLSRAGRLTAVAGLDAHPKTRIGGVLIPSYGAFFNTLANHVRIVGSLPADADSAQAVVLSGLEAGDVYVSFGAPGEARGFDLVATTRSGALVGPGGRIDPAPEPRLRAGFRGGAGGRVLYRVVRDGETLGWYRGRGLDVPASSPGVYRVEVYRYSLRVGRALWNLRPWIFSNPIRVRSGSGPGS